MKKLLLILFLLWTFFTHAQISDSFDKQRLATFYNIYRYKVKTGLLFDYGFHFTNIEKYDGIRSDSNYLSYDECKLLYASVYSCKFNDKAFMLPPAVAFKRIEAAAIEEKNRALLGDQLISSTSMVEKNTTLLVGLHYKYERFRHHAIDSGYIVVDKYNRLREIQGRPSPYVTGETFALVPHRSHLTGPHHRFIFKPELFATNTGKTIGTIEADFGDGAGWRVVVPGSPVYAAYSSDGEKTVAFRVTYTDGSVKESHSKILVSGVVDRSNPQARYGGRNIAELQFPLAGFQSPKPYQGRTAGALVTVEYTNSEREIRKPLIVIEGFDPWRILTPDDNKTNFSFSDAINDDGPQGLRVGLTDNSNGHNLSELLSNANYDLIFIDFDDGTDHIQRNAYLVENVIEWVNSVKQPHHGVIEKNVVIGFSMGGLVARYALRDMELSGKTHDTRLYASIDSPHQGANVPVGFQAAVSHLYGSGVSFAVGGVYQVAHITFGSLSTDLERAYLMLNAPAARQMLIYSVAGAGENIYYDNSAHEAFMNEYSAMGYAQQEGIRNIVLANGSECGTGQGFSLTDPFLKIQGTAAGLLLTALTHIAGPMMGGSYHPYIPAATGLVTWADLKLDAFVLPVSPSTNLVYKFKLTYRKKILFVINQNIELIDKQFNSQPTFLPLDNAAGGVSDITSTAGELPVKPNITRFCFVPTYSALDIGGGLKPIGLSDMNNVYLPANPPSAPKQVVANNFFANPSAGTVTNEIHTQLTQKNATWLFQEIEMKPVTAYCRYVCDEAKPAVAGPNNICADNPLPFVLTGLPSEEDNIAWQATPADYFRTNAGTGSSAPLQPLQHVAPNSEAEVAFTFTSSMKGCKPYVLQKKFRINRPLPEPVINISHFYASPFADVQVITEASPPYHWYVGYRLAAIDHTGTTSIPLSGCGKPLISVRVANACGGVQSGDYAKYRVDFCQWSIVSHPNPASSELIVSVTNSTTDVDISTGTPELYAVSLYSPVQEKVFETTTTDSSVSIPVTDLPEGVYIIDVATHETILRRQVLITH
ncbi:MAG: hypothetical protein ACOYXT_17545 [Bacteroidota bacterium]